VDKNKIDYKPSGLISQHMIKTLNYMHEEIDGIVFKSTKSSPSDFNLAILPVSCDTKLECLNVINCKLLLNSTAAEISQFQIDRKSSQLIKNKI
jgi:hypothetical protein